MAQKTHSGVKVNSGVSSMALSLEFKRAITAAAITRLSSGSRNLESAAKWVSERVGDSLYANYRGPAKAAMLLEHRRKILGATKAKIKPERLAVARYHYEQCLDWVAREGLKPEESARLLINTMLERR